MIQKIKDYGKIITILLLSLFLAQLFNTEFFIGNSPLIRPNLDQYIATRITNTKNSVSKSIALLINSKVGEAQQIANAGADKAFKELESVPFSEVAKGTYAKSNATATITEVTLGEIEADEYTFELKGQTVKIRVPKSANISEEQLKKELGAN